jgi:maleylpyruvate isomerase
MPARHDDVDDPRLAAMLALARRGTAYFSRKLNELSDEELDGPSLLPGWSRRHLIAHVGYNARALTRLLEWAATGVETPMYASPEQRRDQIVYGATLSAVALRHLVAHSTVHLNVDWRDLPAQAWQAEVRTAQGRTVPAAETAWMRTREVWIHAVDLDNGASFNDFPPELVDALTADVLAAWRRRGTTPDVLLMPTDRATPEAPGNYPGIILRGTAADLLRWATGRGARRIIASSGRVPEPPTWL